MSLKLNQINFKAEMPKIPDHGVAIMCEAPQFKDRAKGIQGLAKRLDLGELRDADTRFGRAIVSKHGEVEFFAASGAIWAANTAHELKAKDEFLDWQDLSDGKDDDGQPIQILGRKSAANAVDMAKEMIEIGRFDMKHATKPQIKLMQVAQADEKGRTLRNGAGEATIVFGYEINDMPVLGAGGKTLIDLIPKGSDLRPTGAVNVWRQPQKDVKIEIGGADAALEAGLLRDPDLMIAAEKGGKITIEKMRFGLVSMPAALHQGVLFPALEYEARVDFGQKDGHYFTGRVAPVATREAFAKAGLESEHFGLGM